MPEEELIKERIRKLEEIRKMGINPYAYRYDVKDYAEEIKQKFSKLEKEEKTKHKVSIAGRIIAVREMGKAAFANLQDSTGKIQFYLKKDDVGEKQYKLFRLLDIGDIIGIQGTVFKTKTGELSVYVEKLELLSKSLRPLPEKFHGLKDEEVRYRKRYLDLTANPEVKEVFMKRAKIYSAIREFLDKKGFVEVQTPILQTQYGGANARPFVTKINAWDMTMYLRIAYELHLKRLIVGGFSRIYDLSSCFRNEGVDRTHNPEFAMMEVQWAYADYNDTMELTEKLWEYVAKKVLGTTVIGYEGKKIDLKAPWKRLTIKQAIKKYADIDVDKLSDSQLKDLIRKHKIECRPARGFMISSLFEELCEKKIIEPTHITDHPKGSCPLAKPHRADPELIERVEPFINGWEVGNCYSELTDPLVQNQLLKEQAEKGRGGDEESHPMDEDYINALEQGLPPNAGIGVGIDRMVMLLTGSNSIRDVLLFPIMKPEEKVKK
jgi:lysyl-tRNA synthetase class 2